MGDFKVGVTKSVTLGVSVSVQPGLDNTELRLNTNTNTDTNPNTDTNTNSNTNTNTRGSSNTVHVGDKGTFKKTCIYFGNIAIATIIFYKIT